METKELLKDKLSFIQKKSQRLTSAIYLVTSFILDKEPLKWAIRKQVLDINIYIGHSTGLYRTDKIVSLIDQLLSLCEVSQGAGYISDMNYDLLKKEYFGIKELLQKEPDFLALPPVDSEKRVANKSSRTSISIDRRGEILKVFKSDAQYSIREISKVFQGLSHKTVQRDLNLLVDQGVIRKTGERRWSRYSLGA